jgi:hypothetical protein
VASRPAIAITKKPAKVAPAKPLVKPAPVKAPPPGPAKKKFPIVPVAGAALLLYLLHYLSEEAGAAELPAAALPAAKLPAAELPASESGALGPGGFGFYTGSQAGVGLSTPTSGARAVLAPLAGSLVQTGARIAFTGASPSAAPAPSPTVPKTWAEAAQIARPGPEGFTAPSPTNVTGGWSSLSPEEGVILQQQVIQGNVAEQEAMALADRMAENAAQDQAMNEAITEAQAAQAEAEAVASQAEVEAAMEEAAAEAEAQAEAQAILEEAAAEAEAQAEAEALAMIEAAGAAPTPEFVPAMEMVVEPTAAAVAPEAEFMPPTPPTELVTRAVAWLPAAEAPSAAEVSFAGDLSQMLAQTGSTLAPDVAASAAGLMAQGIPESIAIEAAQMASLEGGIYAAEAEVTVAAQAAATEAAVAEAAGAEAAAAVAAGAEPTAAAGAAVSGVGAAIGAALAAGTAAFIVQGIIATINADATAAKHRQQTYAEVQAKLAEYGGSLERFLQHAANVWHEFARPDWVDRYLYDYCVTVNTRGYYDFAAVDPGFSFDPGGYEGEMAKRGVSARRMSLATQAFAVWEQLRTSGWAGMQLISLNPDFDTWRVQGLSGVTDAQLASWVGLAAQVAQYGPPETGR